MVKARNFLKAGIPPSPVEPVSLPFGEWLPDLPEVDNPGAVEALNVIPSEGCYVPFKDIVPVAGLTLPGAAKGGIATVDRAGSPVVYGATTNGIFVRSSSTFASVYTTAITLYDKLTWQFVQFGDSIVALHPQLRPLVSDVGGTSVFSPLAGGPPIAYCGARVGDFLVLGNLDSEVDPDNTRRPNRIRWSAFNNIESPWVTDPATQADFNDMPSEGGAVTAITGREYGTIFQERSISRMSYVGLPEVFAIETVEETRGAISTGSVVDLGAQVLFIAEDGFHVWNGTNSAPIGDNKVNRFFFSRLNYAARDKIVGAVDVVNKCVMWAYPAGNNELPSEVIIFSYKENRFSHSDKVVEWLMSGFTLDASLDDLHGNLDTDYPASFDSTIYKGRRPYLTGFDTTHTFGVFNGAAMAATIDTSEYTGPSGSRVFANSARPIVDLSVPVATIQTLSRDQFRGEALVAGAAVAQEITEECPILVDARYVRLRTVIPAGAVWKQARGVQLWRKSTGRR